MNDALQELPTPDQAAVFRRLRWRLIRNSLHQTLGASRLRVVLIVLCCALIWGCIYAISVEGFRYFMQIKVPLVGGIIGAVFDLLFLALLVLLLFSSGLILYSSLFGSAESAFLLCTPARADQVFATKFRGAVAFSSWAFLLLTSPMLIAYGLAYGVPWYYYVLVLAFVGGFVLLPGSLGALCCLLIANYLPQQRRQILLVAVVGVLVGGGLWLYQLRPADWDEAMQPDYVQRVLGQLATLQGPLSPSHWLSRGIQAAARGDAALSSYYLTLIWSNGLFLYVATAWAARHLYRRGYNRLATGGTLRRRYGGHWLDRLFAGTVRFLDAQTRLLMIKDFRTFRRDPAQWAQILIFTGLIVLYFSNMRRFFQEELGRTFQNLISLLNLAATGLLLSAYTGRFIYPMLSLEGRKFWILGLLPLRRERLLWAKFAFSAAWALFIAEFLVIFSDWMLGVPAHIMVVHALTIAVLAMGLSGISAGLGATMPNFRETDPSKIAVGFGGTLSLIVSLVYLLLVVGLMAGPWHARLALGPPGGGSAFPIGWPLAATAAGVLLGAAAVIVCLRAGAQALRQMEF